MRRFAMALAVTILLTATHSASAALLVFTDRVAWQAAAGGMPDQSEDLNSVTTDQIYGTGQSVTVGFLTFSTSAPFDASWRIDAIPGTFGTIPNVDGTTFATVLSCCSPDGTTAIISFESAVRAIGFDYNVGSYTTGQGELTTSLGDALPLISATGLNFLGLLYTGGETMTSIEVGTSSGATFGAGMDNFEAYAAVVPLPAPILLLMSAILGLAGLRRR